MKTCRQCLLPQSLDAFPKYKRYADGLHRVCKTCHNKNCESARRRKGVKPRLPLAVRFWSHVQQCAHGQLCQACCWEWQKGRDQDGYGKFSMRPGKAIPAHRFAYQLWNNTVVPATHLVCHDCDNPPCCNPSHLWIGTHADNHKDRDRKGRGAWQQPGAIIPRTFGEAHHKAKLKEYQVREIRMLYSQGISSIKLALMYGVAKPVILGIIHFRIWKHVL